MREVFIGPLRHWLMLAVILAVLWLMGATQFHIADFALFLLALGGLAVAAVALVVATWRSDERITRDPLS